jgi:hypothetical protein
VTEESKLPQDSTVSGGYILAMLAAMGPFRKRGEWILADVGIAEVEADRWYPLRAYVEALRMIGEKMGPNTLLQIGKQIPNHAPLPQGLDTFAKVAGSFGPMFDTNHRGTAPGGITWEPRGDRSARITTGTPYPCEFERGIILGLFQKLLRARVSLTHVEDSGCRNEESRTDTYEVTLPLD